MDVIVGIIAIMGGSILILLNVNKKLRNQNKLKDLEIEDIALETKQDAIKKEKSELKKSLNKITADSSDLSDSQIEDFWNNKKGSK
jgi:septal ring factor EnvC (AmiA/AmiB activator)